MAKKNNIKICSTSLVIKEVHVKIMRYYYISIRRLKLKRPTILSVGENVKKLEFTYTDGENIK